MVLADVPAVMAFVRSREAAVQRVTGLVDRIESGSYGYVAAGRRTIRKRTKREGAGVWH